MGEEGVGAHLASFDWTDVRGGSEVGDWFLFSPQISIKYLLCIRNRGSKGFSLEAL